MVKKVVQQRGPMVDIALDLPDGSTVAMVRNEEQYPAPHTADVHVDEVENWAKHGWLVVEVKPEPKAEEPEIPEGQAGAD